MPKSKMPKSKIYILASHYCGAGIYKIEFSDGKIMQVNCWADMPEDKKGNFSDPLLLWLDNLPDPKEAPNAKEPKAHFKVSDERNFD